MRTPGLSDAGIYHRSQPTAFHKFSEDTKRQASMAGVQYATFTCKQCGKPKSIEGRKRLSAKYPQDGYKCADCASG